MACCLSDKALPLGSPHCFTSHGHGEPSPLHPRQNCVYKSLTLKLSFKHIQGETKCYFRIKMSHAHVLHYISMTVFTNFTLLKLKENINKQPIWKECEEIQLQNENFFPDYGFGQKYL